MRSFIDLWPFTDKYCENINKSDVLLELGCQSTHFNPFVSILLLRYLAFISINFFENSN